MMSDDTSISGQRAFYDQHWSSHTYANHLRLERCVEILSLLYATNLREPAMVELGSGTGWLTAVLGHFGPTLGVELSPAAVRSASERHRHVRFVEADLTSWDYPKGDFDVVISSEVIEHLEDQRRHIIMARDLLRARGYLILTTPNAATMAAMPDEKRKSWSTQPIENWLTRSQLKDLLIANGFRILRLGTVTCGVGRRGMYRYVNSTKLHNVLKSVGLGYAYDAFRLKVGLGLHTAVLAQRS